MIQVINIRKAYGSLVAVDGVSFEVRPGETFGLLGPNGAGKTTTILMMAGALRPDAGRVVLEGAADPTLPTVPSIPSGIVPSVPDVPLPSVPSAPPMPARFFPIFICG